MMIVESASSVWKSSVQTRIYAVVGLLTAVLAVGCGGVPKTYVYTLQTPSLPAPTDTRTRYVLGVEHFRAPQILRDDRIVYYLSPTEISFYEHHRWGAEPAALLSEFTAEWLQSSGVFAQVKMVPFKDLADYTLGGQVTNFEEVDADGGVKVRLALVLSLVRNSDRKLVWSGTQREEMPRQGEGVAGVASTMNTACGQALREMIPGLVAQVEQDFKSSGK